MTVSAVAGAAAAWLLILVLGTGAGYGTVLAWSRWGARLGLPPAASRILVRLLGPIQSAVPNALDAAHTGPGPAPSVPVAPDTVEESAPATAAKESGSAGGAVAASVPGGRATETLNESETPPDADGPEPGMEDDEAGALVSGTQAPAATEGSDDPATAEHVGQGGPDTEPSPHEISRTEALSELSAVLGIDYEDAVAVLGTGLWGFENFEEWSRAMRKRERPAAIRAEAWDAILRVDWAEIQPKIEQHRERRRSTSAFETLWGVGPDEAEALFEAGYRELAAIRKASTEMLAKIPGIGPAKAFQIRAAAYGLAPTP